MQNKKLVQPGYVWKVNTVYNDQLRIRWQGAAVLGRMPESGKIICNKDGSCNRSQLP